MKQNLEKFKDFVDPSEALWHFSCARFEPKTVTVVLRIHLATTVADAVTCLLSLKSISYAPFSTPNSFLGFFRLWVFVDSLLNQ